MIVWIYCGKHCKILNVLSHMRTKYSNCLILNYYTLLRQNLTELVQSWGLCIKCIYAINNLLMKNVSLELISHNYFSSCVEFFVTSLAILICWTFQIYPVNLFKNLWMFIGFIIYTKYIMFLLKNEKNISVFTCTDLSVWSKERYTHKNPFIICISAFSFSLYISNM